MAIPNKEGCFALFPVLLHGRVLNLPVPPKKKKCSAPLHITLLFTVIIK